MRSFIEVVHLAVYSSLPESACADAIANIPDAA